MTLSLFPTLSLPKTLPEMASLLGQWWQRPRIGFRVRVSGNGIAASEVDLAAGEYVLGSAPSADIIVPDAKAEELLVLRLAAAGRSGSVSAVPLAEGLRARDRNLYAGATVLFGDRARIESEDLVILVSAIESEDLQRTAPVRLLAAAALVGFGLTTLGLSGVVQSTFAALFDGSREMANAVRSSVFDDVDELKRRLAEVGLGDSLSARVERNGVLLSGHLAAEEGRKVRDVIDAMHMRSGISITTDLDLEPAQTGSLFAAITVAPRLFVVTPDDRKLEVGDRLPNGLRIKKITEESVMLDSDGIPLRVNFFNTKE